MVLLGLITGIAVNSDKLGGDHEIMDDPNVLMQILGFAWIYETIWLAIKCCFRAIKKH